MTLLYDDEYLGLSMVISGGQCGADRAGLEAAAEFSMRTGGWAPKGWRTHHGPAPELANFNLVEDTSSDYPPRTKKNVQHSNGTVIFGSNLASPGCVLTARLCSKHQKPIFHVLLNGEIDEDFIECTAADIAKWVEQNEIKVLNVAGNRDKSLSDDFHFITTKTILLHAFNILDQACLINR